MSQEDSDQDMADAAAGAEQNGVDHEEIQFEKQRLKLLPNSTETAASFAFEKEDHTLGNALRYIIMKNPDVEFCGYSIPHPSEAVMNLRIQTWDGVSVFEVLRKALDDLADLCDVVEEKFETAKEDFNVSQPDGVRS